MRISRLNLLKYGHFDGTAFELPISETDIHIVYGDNEAGKSTALVALENLLFEFPQGATPFSFLHGTNALRVGAVLESDGDSFEFLRRKGRSGTIVADDGQAIPEGEKTLAALLQGVDKEFFQRMFFLNQSRLRRGADNLLAVGDDAGQMLLASGAGIPGLAEVLKGYDERATSLWAKARSKNRRFYQVNDKLNQAIEDQRNALVNVSTYKAIKRAYEKADAAFESARENVQTLQARLQKLGRIRRVHRDVLALISAGSAIAEMDDVAQLPEDAADQLDEAQRVLGQLSARRSVFEERISVRKSEIEKLPVDEVLLQRSTEISALNELRVKVQDSRDDLPRRYEDLKKIDESVQSFGQDLGWALDNNDVRALLPPSTVVAKARDLVTRHATLVAQQDIAKNALGTARRRTARLKENAPAEDSLLDSTALRAAYTAAQADGKVVGLREGAEEHRDRAKKAIDGLLEGLSPAVADARALRAMAVPSIGRIEAHRDGLLSLKNKRDAIEADLNQFRRTIEDDEQLVDTTQQSDGVLSDDDIQALRERRDEAWALIAKRHIDGASVDDSEWRTLFGGDEQGKEQYEALVGQADAGADERFGHAEAATLLNEARERIKAGQKGVTRLEKDLEELESRQDVLDDEWTGLWTESGVTRGTVDQMVSWTNARAAIVDQLTELEDANVQVERYSAKEGSHIDALISEIKALGGVVETLTDSTLTAIMAMASQVAQGVAEAHKEANSQQEAIGEAEENEAEKAANLEKIEGEVVEWTTRWKAVLGELRLSEGTRSEDVEAYITLIDQVRMLVDEGDGIQHDRIEKMERDIEVYEERTRNLVDVLAKDLSDEKADDAVHGLVARLNLATSNREKCLAARADIDRDQDELDELSEQERGSNEVLAELHRQASTKSIKLLEKAILESDAFRELKEKIDSLTDTLNKDGDGRSITELKEEVKGVDLDEATAEAIQLEEDVKAHDEATTSLRDAMLEAKAEYNIVGASGDAAAAASRIEYARAELDTVAESFVRARAAERLLRWGVDYLRKQKLGPLLQKASTLFSTVTGGRYDTLVVEYEDDKPVLAGVDANGAQKAISAMSDGTRDQLYLALRLAAVDDYMDRAAPMPFVADDIFVNFDDTRTGFAIEALAALSKRCQVIIFTHHRRLVEIAQSMLPVSPTIIDLT